MPDTSQSGRGQAPVEIQPVISATTVSGQAAVDCHASIRCTPRRRQGIVASGPAEPLALDMGRGPLRAERASSLDRFDAGGASGVLAQDIGMGCLTTLE